MIPSVVVIGSFLLIVQFLGFCLSGSPGVNVECKLKFFMKGNKDNQASKSYSMEGEVEMYRRSTAIAH